MLVDSSICYGCSACEYTCPEEAITMQDVMAGEWLVSKSRFGNWFVHARLGIGEGNSGKLVSRVKQEARRIAAEEKVPCMIADGPPGIGCPVHASLTGCDLALIVTEPTPSGEHDLERVLQLLDHFKLPAAVLINKYDLSPEITARIEALAKKANAEVVGKLPFSPEVPRALARGELPLAVEALALPLTEVWQRIRAILSRALIGFPDSLGERPDDERPPAYSSNVMFDGIG